MNFTELQSKMQLKKSKNAMVSYSSRSAEDILDKFKSLESDWVLTLEDSVQNIGEASYFTSKAFCRKGDELYSATHTQPLSEPPLTKAGKPTMSLPQWFGAVSSYARKYALQGLFAMGETDFDQLEASTTVGEGEQGKKTVITMEELTAKVEAGEIDRDAANQLVKLGKVSK